MKRVVGVVGSAIVHLIVFLLLFLKFSQTDTKKDAAGEAPADPVTVTLLFETGQAESGVSTEPLYTADGKICPPGSKTYQGIGFVYKYDTGQIIVVPPELPAFKAGIRVGDLLLNNPVPEPNGMMYPHILREYTILKFEIKATEICYSLEEIDSI